jgi:guanine deaminase
MSNSMLRSGMLNVRRLITEGVHVSLGTDVSGGASPSMLSAIREALKISNMVSVVEGSEYAPLTYAEAFWLATAGGARALGVEGLTGNFGVGSVFDALVIQPDADGPIDLYEGEGSREAFQKWLQLGDDRNTAAVYVEGRKVWSPPE